MSKNPPLIITDINGNKFHLPDGVIKHIKLQHPDLKEDPVSFVTNVLKDPLLITEDESLNTVIYHRKANKPLLHIAYVEVVAKRVKSAHITDKLKGGKIKWVHPSKKIIG